MGCSGSKFRVDSGIKGQGPEVMKLASQLKLNQNDLDKLFTSFKKVDNDAGGNISVDEFIVINQISQEYLGELIFKIFDKDGNGDLTFYEYIFACWNFLSYDKKALSGFLFEIFDFDRSSSLSYKELKFLFYFIWSFKPESHMNAVFAQLDGNKDGKITPPELYEFARHNNLVLFPAFQLQDMLRRATLGDDRWVELSKIREKIILQEDEHYYASDRRAARERRGLQGTMMTLEKRGLLKDHPPPEKFDKLLHNAPPIVPKKGANNRGANQQTGGKDLPNKTQKGKEGASNVVAKTGVKATAADIAEINSLYDKRKPAGKKNAQAHAPGSGDKIHPH